MQLKTLFRRTLISASLTGFILAGLATINSASLDKPSSTGPIEEFADADVATDYVVVPVWQLCEGSYDWARKATQAV